ncbi:MAG: HIT domain-containing protein, partial [bacterium]|nr:HIT domain-containing protein [bacterium]
QREEMERIIAADHCPFCPENLHLYHKKPKVRETQYWTLTPNTWPYKHTKVHYLAILKRHAENLSELTKEEGGDLFTLLGSVQKELNIPGGAMTMRFGDTKHSAGTVRHLHAHFLVPDLDDPEYVPVRFKIGGDKS